jgi:anti-sigma factor ChrR (cupin superfamily)
MNDTWTERLSEYIDGTLAETERGALEAHLAGCAACRTTLDELRRVVARAQALDDRPPVADLWPAIAEQIGVSSGAHRVVSLSERRTRRRVAFTVPQLAAAAALLLLLGSGGAYLALHRSPLGDAIAQRGPAADLTIAPVGWVQRTSSRYDAAVAELQSALEQGRASGRLDSATMRVLTQSLVMIDSAIAQARRALAADPGSAYLNQHLADTMRRKLELLRRASALAPART